MEDIYNKFHGKSIERLVNRPKLFLFDKCRTIEGKKPLDINEIRIDNNILNDNNTKGKKVWNSKINIYSNIVTLFSNVSGQESFSKMGVLVESTCQVFKELSDNKTLNKTDFEDIQRQIGKKIKQNTYAIQHLGREGFFDEKVYFQKKN